MAHRRRIVDSLLDELSPDLAGLAPEGAKNPGAHTLRGVCTRTAQRVLALTTAIWFNDLIGIPALRNLTPSDD